MPQGGHAWICSSTEPMDRWSDCDKKAGIEDGACQEGVDGPYRGQSVPEKKSPPMEG